MHGAAQACPFWKHASALHHTVNNRAISLYDQLRRLTWENSVVLGKGLLRLGMWAGHAASGADGPWKSWRRRALADIFKAGASLRLQFPREDLGFVYNSPLACTLHKAGEAPVCLKVSMSLGHTIHQRLSVASLVVVRG